MLSKIRTASTLGGQLWIKDEIGISQIRVLELDALLSSVLAAYSSLVLLLFGFTQPVEDHFSNSQRFSELSEIINYHLACQLVFSFSLSIHFAQRKRIQANNYSHSTKYQNIVTLENERGALSSWYISNQLQWLGFGLSVGP